MKKCRMLITTLLIGILLLTACGGSKASRSKSDEEMQTEIVMLLTSMVTETNTPVVVATETPVLSTDTPEPTIAEATQPPVNAEKPTPNETVQSEVGIPTIGTPSDLQFDMLTFTPTVDKKEENQTAIEEKEITETPAGAEDAAQTSTPAIDDPAEGLGDPNYQDDFSTGDNWSLGKDSYMDLIPSNGKLIMHGISTVSGWRITRASLADGYIQLTGETQICSGIDNYGLYFRVPNAVYANSGYLFGITCDGRYALRKWNGETMTSLIYWKPDEAIHTGEGKTNKIGVLLNGHEMKLYINGEYVARAIDDDYDIGSIGVYIGAKESGDMTVFLDDLSVWRK